ncbi:MAG: hypothetical protein ACREQR_01110 [Candidatus Binataceae bacterium]
MGTRTDRIETKVLPRASREQVWRAIGDSKQFGSWFAIEDGPDYSREPTTLVVFEPAAGQGGTILARAA